MLEYWMQNGTAALFLRHHNIANRATERLVRLLLGPLFQANGNHSGLTYSLFSPLRQFAVENQPQRNGILEYIHGKITERPRQNLSCTYCGRDGANEMPSYVFPFVTKRSKFPNAYSWGNPIGQSLNLCPECMLIGLAANNRLLFNLEQPRGTRTGFYSVCMFFSKDAPDLVRFYNGFIDPILASSYKNNINLFKFQPNRREYAQGVRGYDIIKYSEEFLAVLIDHISLQIDRQNKIKKELGVLLFSYSLTTIGFSTTKIYDSVEIIDSIHPFVAAFRALNRNDRYAFRKIFRKLRTSTNEKKPKPGDFTSRKKFLRELLIYKKLDWKTIENIIMHYA